MKSPFGRDAAATRCARPAGVRYRRPAEQPGMQRGRLLSPLAKIARYDRAHLAQLTIAHNFILQANRDRLKTA